MSSAIDPTKPVAGNPTTQSVRDNFLAAKTEIEGLQGSSGTWTPDLTFTTPGNQSITYTTRAGQWKKRGKRIYWSMFIQTATFTHSTASGALVINGLPETVENTANYYPNGVGTISGGATSGFHDAVFRTDFNTTQLKIVGLNTANQYASANAVDFPTGSAILIIASGDYEAT